MSFTYKKVPIIAAMAIATATQLSHAQQLEEIIVTAQKRSESLQDATCAE